LNAGPQQAGWIGKSVPVFHATVAFEHRSNPSRIKGFMVKTALTMLLRL
jgi:hypothetical protein